MTSQEEKSKCFPFSFFLITGRFCLLFAETVYCIPNPDQWIHDHKIGKETDLCAYLSVSNFVYPQWYPIPCNKSVYVDVICGDIISTNSHNNMRLNLDSKIMCQSG